MIKRNPISLVIILLLGISLVIAGQLYLSNSELKAQMIEAQESADERIENLEKKLATIDDKPEKQEVIQANPEVDEAVAAIAQNAGFDKFMDEDALLESFFAEVPTMIHGGQEASDTQVPSTGPILEVSPSTFDLGTISKQNGPVEATYQLKNAGTDVLTISYAFTSCGCTAAPIEEEVALAPGDTYPLKVSYNPNFYGPNYELGPIEKSVTILSNYSANPFYKVKLQANVTP